VGVFDIGGLPEILEKEGNDWRKPQAISLPVLVNGEIGSEDWDHFRFHAEAGQKMIFDVSATRHGSRLDADVAILDERGEELAWVDDTTIFGDPHLEFTFSKTGDYVVRVGHGAGHRRSGENVRSGAISGLCDCLTCTALAATKSNPAGKVRAHRATLPPRAGNCLPR
jgi:hypothetical protein